LPEIRNTRPRTLKSYYCCGRPTEKDTYGLFFIHLSELDEVAETANRFPDSPWETRLGPAQAGATREAHQNRPRARILASGVMECEARAESFRPCALICNPPRRVNPQALEIHHRHHLGRIPFAGYFDLAKARIRLLQIRFGERQR
jgi:hypothetical protein